MTFPIKGALHLSASTFAFVGIEALDKYLHPDGTRGYDFLKECRSYLLPSLGLQIGAALTQTLGGSLGPKSGAPSLTHLKATLLASSLFSLGMLALGNPPRTIATPLTIIFISKLISSVVEKTLSQPKRALSMPSPDLDSSAPRSGTLPPEEPATASGSPSAPSQTGKGTLRSLRLGHSAPMSESLPLATASGAPSVPIQTKRGTLRSLRVAEPDSSSPPGGVQNHPSAAPFDDEDRPLALSPYRAGFPSGSHLRVGGKGAGRGVATTSSKLLQPFITLAAPRIGAFLASLFAGEALPHTLPEGRDGTTCLNLTKSKQPRQLQQPGRKKRLAFGNPGDLATETPEVASKSASKRHPSPTGQGPLSSPPPPLSPQNGASATPEHWSSALALSPNRAGLHLSALIRELLGGRETTGGEVVASPSKLLPQLDSLTVSQIRRFLLSLVGGEVLPQTPPEGKDGVVHLDLTPRKQRQLGQGNPRRRLAFGEPGDAAAEPEETAAATTRGEPDPLVERKRREILRMIETYPEAALLKAWADALPYFTKMNFQQLKILARKLDPDPAYQL